MLLQGCIKYERLVSCSIMLERYKKERRWANQNFNASVILFFLIIFYFFSLLRYVEEGINKPFWLLYSSPLFLLFFIYCIIGKFNSCIHNNEGLVKTGKRVSTLAIIYGIIAFIFMLYNHSMIFYEYFFFHVLCIISIVKWMFFFTREMEASLNAPSSPSKPTTPWGTAPPKKLQSTAQSPSTGATSTAATSKSPPTPTPPTAKSPQRAT